MHQKQIELLKDPLIVHLRHIAIACVGSSLQVENV